MFIKDVITKNVKQKWKWKTFSISAKVRTQNVTNMHMICTNIFCNKVDKTF